jgi:hypothetical protein
VQPFVESEALAIFRRYQRSGRVEELNELLKRLLPVIETIICKRLGHIVPEYDEIMSYATRKLCGGLQRCYDPQRGSLFNFTTKLVEHCLIDSLRRKVAQTKHTARLEDEMIARFGVNGTDHVHALHDITYRVMQVKTTVRARHELEAQRWLVRNLLRNDFAFYRWEAADAMTLVYEIPHDRARRLFDLTLLSVRRQLIGERKLKPIDPRALRSMKDKPLLRYRSALSEEKFSRLVYLMRNLAPSIIGEFSLSDVLYGPGPPREVALFSHQEALAAASRLE